MKIEKGPLQDTLIITLDRFEDLRGVFTVRYSEEIFGSLGFKANFVQDNHSLSKPRVLRGMHFQTNPSQGKLVNVTRGKILDVIVDLRKKSSTFGKHFAIELSEKSALALWIPKGFAHGFCVLGDEDAEVFYKVDAPYAPKAESGLRFDDPGLGISWPKMDFITNEKDLALPSFESYLKNPVF